MFRSYAPILKRHRFFLIFVFVLYGFGSLFTNVLLPLVYRNIIDTVSFSGERTAVAGDLMNHFYWLVLCVVMYQVLFRGGDYAIVYVQSKLMKEISDDAFAGIERQSYRFFSSNFTGSLVAKAKRYVRAFESLLDYSVYHVWMTFVNICGVIITVFVLSPPLGLMFLVWVILYLLLALWFARRKLTYDVAVSQQDSSVVARLSDFISNILVVKTFSAGSREKETFEGETRKEEILRRRAWNYQNFIFIIQIGLLSLLELGGMYGAITFWLRGDLSAGTVALVQIYIAGVFSALFSLGRVFAKIAQSIADADEMSRIIALEPEVRDAALTRDVPVVEGRIDFSDVAFGYPGGERVFDDFNLCVEKGEKVGLVGPSGAGKTTVTKLLLRYMDPQKGSIRVDGWDIRSVRQDDLRRHIAYVSQEPILFHRTIRENIAYGKTDASQSDVEDAARKAEAHAFISLLPKGYDTLVGERGVKLSGGERQRVAIARAILKNAPILILDEATSSLDSENEALIQAALEDLMEGKTAIVIAHRLSTIRKLDRIIVLDKRGKIVEEGTHDELLARAGLYAGLWGRQTGSFIGEGD